MSHSPAQFIDRPDGLVELCSHLRKVGKFGFDTEFVTEDTYTPQLCLVQVATQERMAVVDAMVVRDLKNFWRLVADPRIQVVAHAAEAEIGFCRRAISRPPAALFDVQIAAGLAGHGYPLSYGVIVRRVLGQTVGGTETRTEWRQRPLSDEQIAYALEDVAHLLGLHEKLSGALMRARREAWAEEEFRHKVSLSESSNQQAWMRVSRVTSLGPRQLAVLRELVAWREREARRRNRPIRSLATDDILRELARRQPTDRRQLLLLRGMKRRRLEQAAGELLDAVRRGLAVPEDQCPTLPRKPEDSQRVRLLTGLLHTAVALVCVREQLFPAMVASTAELTVLVRSYLNTGRFPPESRIASGWRGQLFGQLFTDLLEGKLCLRVDNLASDMPLTLEARAASR